LPGTYVHSVGLENGGATVNYVGDVRRELRQRSGAFVRAPLAPAIWVAFKDATSSGVFGREVAIEPVGRWEHGESAGGGN
jgi:hypothetical protein